MWGWEGMGGDNLPHYPAKMSIFRLRHLQEGHAAVFQRQRLIGNLPNTVL